MCVHVWRVSDELLSCTVTTSVRVCSYALFLTGKCSTCTCGCEGICWNALGIWKLIVAIDFAEANLLGCSLTDVSFPTTRVASCG